MGMRALLALGTALLMSCAIIASIDTFERAPADAGADAPGPGDANAGLPTCRAPCDPSVCPNGSCFAQIATELASPSSIAILGDVVVWANEGAVDGGGSLMMAPKGGGRIQAFATDLVAPRVSGAALDAGAPVAFERFANPPRISLSAIERDGGLSALDDGTGIESAEASRSWFAFTRGKGVLRARDRTGGPPYDESSTRAVLGLTGDILVTVTTADAVLLRRLSVEDDGSGTNVAKATKLAEHPLASVTSAVIDDEQVYLATASAYVEAALLDGGALRRVTSFTGKIIAMAVDENDLYVAASDGIVKIDKRSHQTVRRYPVVAAGIALDERFIYFTNPALGTVTRAPR